MIYPEIKSITVVLGKDTHKYECGINEVTKIKDMSEIGESVYATILYVMQGEAVKLELINLPCIIEHF
jgi:hypothetical protein